MGVGVGVGVGVAVGVGVGVAAGLTVTIVALEVVVAPTRVMIGPFVSRTITGNVVDATLFATSCAVHETVVVPSANAEPENGAQVGTMLPSLMSKAVTVNITVVEASDVASAITLVGAVITGAAVSGSCDTAIMPKPS